MIDNKNGKGSKGRILGLLGALILMALGAGAYWYLTQQSSTPTAGNPESSPIPNQTAPTEPVINAGGETAASSEPAGTKRGIVLQDNVASHEKEFDEKSAQVEGFNTGDAVTVYDRKWKGEQGGDSDYSVGIEKKGWIDAKYVLVPDEVGALDIFFSSTPPLAELMRDTPAQEKEKLAILDSKDFLLRCAHNSKADSASPCIKRYFYSAPTGSVLRWLELAADEKIPHKNAISSEQFPIFGSALSSTDSKQFAEGFKKLPEDLKKLTLESNCTLLAQAPEVFGQTVKVVVKDSKVVFDSLATCVNETIAKDRIEYGSALEILRKEIKSGKTFSKDQRKALKI